MKKIFSFFAMALFAMTAFAQTNLFNPATSTVGSWFGAIGSWEIEAGSTATYDAATGAITVNIAENKDGQWKAQVSLKHGITFDATKYYQVSYKFTCNQAVNGVTIKVDDNTGFIFEDQTVNLPAGEYVYTSRSTKAQADNGDAAKQKQTVFDFGHATAGAVITISEISYVEAEEPEINYCEGEFVASSGNAALGHDGNTGSRWESAHADPQYWQWNMAEAQTFNRIKIVWEGAYGKTFNIKAGMSCDNLTTIASIENQALAGFPYTQIIELSESVTAQHILFEGIERGTGYGYSFFEFDVYQAQTSVLSNLDFTAAAAVCKVGENVNLTATPKDQYNLAMEAEVTYTVTPAAAGHVTDGVYTADAAGLATITATAGEFSKTVTVFNYEGENVALNKTVTGEGFNDAARVNDGNEGTEYQADSRNGGNPKEWDAEFVIDLGAAYDLNLVTIKFEGACSDAYTLETSADNVTFAVAYNYSGTNGINGHTDFLYGENLANAAGVRYIKFHSTKNATDWGCKIFELKAFGVEHVGTSLEDVDTVETVKFIQNGQLFIMKNGVLYNALGVRL